MSIAYETKIITTTPYTITSNDEVLLINVTGPSSIILPATGNHSKEEKLSFYIKDYSGLARTNPITITAAGGKTIDGSSFAMLNSGYSHIQVIYDGTNWKIIG